MSRAATAPRPGTLYGIGAGPGDPELLTVKAARILREVPIVFVPVAREGGSSLARKIIGPHLRKDGQRLLELVFAMRESETTRAERWAENARVIAEQLAEGCDAAFITEGDPTLYSTFLHIVGVLQQQLPAAKVVIVPGISSIAAAAAAAQVPLVDGAERLAVLPALYDPASLREPLRSFDCVVLMKLAGAMETVLDMLEDMQLTDRAVFVSRCGWPEQEVVRDVRSLRGKPVDYFSLLIVRKQR